MGNGPSAASVQTSHNEFYALASSCAIFWANCSICARIAGKSAAVGLAPLTADPASNCIPAGEVQSMSHMRHYGGPLLSAGTRTIFPCCRLHVLAKLLAEPAEYGIDNATEGYSTSRPIALLEDRNALWCKTHLTGRGQHNVVVRARMRIPSPALQRSRGAGPVGSFPRIWHPFLKPSSPRRRRRVKRSQCTARNQDS